MGVFHILFILLIGRPVTRSALLIVDSPEDVKDVTRRDPSFLSIVVGFWWDANERRCFVHRAGINCNYTWTLFFFSDQAFFLVGDTSGIVPQFKQQGVIDCGSQCNHMAAHTWVSKLYRALFFPCVGQRAFSSIAYLVL